MKRGMCIFSTGIIVGFGSLGGCTAALVVGAAAAGVAGTYIYTEGRLESTEQASLDDVYEATLSALDDLEFPIKSQAKDALEARIVAVQADETEVKIALEESADQATEVRIRVGVTGDEKVSRAVLERIRSHLENRS